MLPINSNADIPILPPRSVDKKDDSSTKTGGFDEPSTVSTPEKSRRPPRHAEPPTSVGSNSYLHPTDIDRIRPHPDTEVDSVNENMNNLNNKKSAKKKKKIKEKDVGSFSRGATRAEGHNGPLNASDPDFLPYDKSKLSDHDGDLYMY